MSYLSRYWADLGDIFWWDMAMWVLGQVMVCTARNRDLGFLQRINSQFLGDPRDLAVFE